MKTDYCIATGLRALKQLDLSQVKRKLMEPYPEGKDWDQETADLAEKWYRRFLEVCLRHPDFPVVPNGVIDTFWHQHILDTQAYAQDCQAIFGEFMHHYPYFGLNGDAVQRDDAFVETNKMYIELFGEPCTQMASNCNMSACRADDPRSPEVRPETKASGCNHSGSGTGCGQGGRGGRSPVIPVRIPNMEVGGKCAGNYTDRQQCEKEVASSIDGGGVGCHPHSQHLI